MLLLLATFCYPASARVMETVGQKKMKGSKELTETEANSEYDTNHFVLQMRRQVSKKPLQCNYKITVL